MSKLSDSEQFSRLYASHAERVIAFFARRTYDPQLSLDLAAETFAQAFSGRHRFRGTSDEEAAAWLFAIANRQLTRYWRRGRAEQRAVNRLGVQVPRLTEDESARVIELSGLHDLRKLLADELAALPEPTRAAIQLRVVEEREYSQVAELLGITEIAARARVSRGLIALATSLEHAGYPEGSA